MESLILQVLPILLAVTLHEVAHGWVAWRLGDPTARAQNRLSLNPIAHVDPIGTVLFPAIQAISMGFVFFGWAKPVPVNPAYFRGDPRRGMMWVALGGPAANLVQALIAGGLLQLMWHAVPGLPMALATEPTTLAQKAAVPLFLMCKYAIHINAVLMAFNLIPIPPLDGSRVAYALLPIEAARNYARLERYGLFIVMGLVFFVPGFIRAFVDPVYRALLWILGLGG